MAGRSLVSIYVDSRWYDIPCPSDYTGSSSTLVDSGRNIKGEVVAQVIKSDVAKIELKWKFMTVSDYAELAQIFEPKYHNGDTSVFFRAVTFFDVVKGGFDGSNSVAPTNSSGSNPCRVFYCGDRKVNFAKLVLNDDGTPKGYQDVSLNLIDTGFHYNENGEIKTAFNIVTNLTNIIANSRNPIAIEEDATAQLYFSAKDGYVLPSSITVTGAEYTWDNETGELVLSDATEDVSITITAALFELPVVDGNKIYITQAFAVNQDNNELEVY